MQILRAEDADILLPYQWKQRPYQENLWRYLENGGTRAACVWHRRSGKDDVALHWACVAAHQRVGTYWHMLPEAAQAKKAIWNAVNQRTGKRRIDEAFPIELRANWNETEMFIRFKNGSTWQVVGSDNYNSLVGSPPIGVVLSEWSLANPAAWAYLLPILTENGGWAIFIYTPRGKNHGLKTITLAQKDPKWFGEILTVDDTRAMPQSALDEALQEYQSLYGDEAGQAYHDQEYRCSFEAAILGSVYGEVMAKARHAGRITAVEYNELLPVHTGWDLGENDATAIWFYQVLANELHLIDYHQSQGKDVPYYAELLRSYPWKHNYGRHVLPHDGGYKLLAAGGRSIVQQFRDAGFEMEVLPSTSHLQSHSAARQTIGVSWFDSKACEQGIDCLTSYRYEWDEKNRCFKQNPLHDWSSDGCDAFETVARSWRGESLKIPKPGVMNPTQQPIADILAARARKRREAEF